MFSDQLENTASEILFTYPILFGILVGCSTHEHSFTGLQYCILPLTPPTRNILIESLCQLLAIGGTRLLLST